MQHTGTMRIVMPGVKHRQHKGSNDRAKDSHWPGRRWERIMRRFKPAGQAQRLLSVRDQVANLFRRPAATSASDYRMSRRVWSETTAVAPGI